MSLRIVHCATTHRPDDPRIFWKECRSLAAAGHEVVYIAPHDRDEVVDDVRILAVPPPASGPERLTRTVAAVFRRARGEGRDAVIHLHDSDLLGAGLALKLAGRRVVYDAHEDTPKQMRYQHWIPRPARPLAALAAAATEFVAGRVFDGIVAAEPANAGRFPGKKTVLVRNYPIVRDLIDPEEPPYEARPPIMLYLGSITQVRGLEEMLRLAELLHVEIGAELLLGGPFHPATLRSSVEGRRGVHALGYVAREDVASVMARARLGLVLLHPERKYVEAYPTKLFEYMAAGLPVVASDFPEWRRIVLDAGAGLTVDPRDDEAIADAARWLLQHPDEARAMGLRGRAAVMQQYDWTSEAERLVAFYHRFSATRPYRTRS